jgi:hypothetical protein
MNKRINNSPKPCGLPEKEIDSIAEEVAHIFEFKEGQDLDGLVKSMNGLIEYKPNGEVSAATATISVKKGNPPKFTIFLPLIIFPLRKRFSIAHELGHLLLHSQFGKHDLEATHSEISENSDLAEEEANRFARALLIPATKLQEEYDKGLSLVDLSAHFLVPLPVMNQRIQEVIKS